MAATIEHWVDNRSPSLRDTIRVDGVAFNLTGSTVKLKARFENDADLKIDAAAVVEDADDGIVRYDWTALDVDTAGELAAWWEVTLPGGKTQDTPEFTIALLEHAPLARGLCELQDVTAYAPGYTGDDATNALLEQMIRAESYTIQRRTGIEFVGPAGTTIRRYDLGDFAELEPGAFAPREVWIDPLADDTGLIVRVIDSDGATVLSTIAGADYDLLPFSRDAFAPYDRIRFWRGTAGAATLPTSGILELESTAWGYQAIPPDIVQACAQRVILRYVSDAAAAGTEFAEMLSGVNLDALLASSNEVIDDYHAVVVA